MPAQPRCAQGMVADAGAEPSRADAELPARLEPELVEASDPNGAPRGATENQEVGAGVGGERRKHRATHLISGAA
jgi:hypothetical protein